MIHFSEKKKREKKLLFFPEFVKNIFLDKNSVFAAFFFFQHINTISMLWGLLVSHEKFVSIIFAPLYIHNEAFSLAFFPIFILFFSNLIRRFLVWMLVFYGSIFLCFSLIQKVFSKYFSIYIYFFPSESLPTFQT